MRKNNVSHGAEDVAVILQSIYMERYKIDLKKEVGCVASDTCPSAANVAGNLNGNQSDCEMHAVSLSLGYTMGVKENQRTNTVVDEEGETKKVISIVTPGGAFPDGERLVTVSKKVVQFFVKSPQRKDTLNTIVIGMDLPKIALKNFPSTRVGYVTTTFPSLLANDT